MDLGLSGQVALITGGSRGIGRATAMSLAKEGCRVGICARGEERLNSALEEFRSIGPDVWGTVSDVTDRADTERFVSDASERLGGVDALVCNVGGSAGGSTLEATDEEWHHTLDVNLMHSVRTIRAAAAPHERGWKGGDSDRIIYIWMETRPQGPVWRRESRRDIPFWCVSPGAGPLQHPGEHGVPRVHPLSGRWVGPL